MTDEPDSPRAIREAGFRGRDQATTTAIPKIFCVNLA
jgi:hypothetical protein